MSHCESGLFVELYDYFSMKHRQTGILSPHDLISGLDGINYFADLECYCFFTVTLTNIARVKGQCLSLARLKTLNRACRIKKIDECLHSFFLVLAICDLEMY